MYLLDTLLTFRITNLGAAPTGKSAIDECDLKPKPHEPLILCRQDHAHIRDLQGKDEQLAHF